MSLDNPILKDMTPEEIGEFYEKCVESKEYFWNHYVRKLPGNENLPEFSEETFNDWIRIAEEMRIKPRRRL